MTLATVARAAGTTVEVLRGLNPSLLRDRLSPEQPTALVRVPPGTAAACRSALAGATGAADRVGTHVLKVGETLDDLAVRHGVSARELRRLNGVREAAELRGGTLVVVPLRPEGAASFTLDTGQDDDDFLLAGVPAREFSYPERERVFYRTCEGDSVEELAQIFQVEPAELLSWNTLDPGARLQPRMVLQLFVRPGLAASDRVALADTSKLQVATLGSEAFHVLEVRRRAKNRTFVTARVGDTLVKIARRLGLEPGDLARVNRQAWWTELPEGQKVVVYAPLPRSRELSVGRTMPPKRPAAAPPVRGGASTRPGADRTQ